MSTTAFQTQQQSAPPLRYHRGEAQFDGAYELDGSIKPHWQGLLDNLEQLGAATFTERQQKALRILRDDGANYNIYGNADKASQTWALDLVPNVISSDEWAVIEAGLLERAELFNLLLRDIYGPRNLIRQGVIPPEALFAHAGFLRSCDGIQLAGEQQLILHSCDLLRATDGSFCVVTDRTQSPSGAGYALENRTVMSRVLPSLYRDSHVHRLASFFHEMRAKLTALAPNQESPRVVVLTPGTLNEAYFEHAYLANYLGFHLVQSRDLVVRDGLVYMKSLDGLSRVDVILRRVDDWYCDPVELRSDSQLGVAGLLEVARNGRVVIANPLGSGALENPILIRYLPQIAKALLGRELRLASVENYWCGDVNDFAYVLGHLDELVIKPIYRGSGSRSVRPRELSRSARENLVKTLKHEPMQYVAQPILPTTSLPSFVDQQLQPRPAILRSFAVAGRNSYTLMPGGLTRVGNEPNAFVISNQFGSYSKDTWVIASEPELNPSLDNVEQTAPTRDADLISLPSRVVENLFWMGRYAERAEASLRILRTVFLLLNGEEPISPVTRRLLLEAVSAVTDAQPSFTKASAAELAAPEQLLLRLVIDGELYGSVHANLNAMLNSASESTELLSSDTLRVINDISDALDELDVSLSSQLSSAPEEALDPLVTALMALSGLLQESMIRGIGWRFIDMGRRLERAEQTSRLVNSLVVPEVPEADQQMVIQAMLLSLEALISYRRRYRARMGIQSALDLVLMDASNPRSLLYQLKKLVSHIKALPRISDSKHELSPEQRAAVEAKTRVQLSVLTELSARADGKRPQLALLLDGVNANLGTIGTLISDKYFDHRISSQQLVRNTWDGAA